MIAFTGRHHPEDAGCVRSSCDRRQPRRNRPNAARLRIFEYLQLLVVNSFATSVPPFRCLHVFIVIRIRFMYVYVDDSVRLGEERREQTFRRSLRKTCSSVDLCPSFLSDLRTSRILQTDISLFHGRLGCFSESSRPNSVDRVHCTFMNPYDSVILLRFLETDPSDASNRFEFRIST